MNKYAIPYNADRYSDCSDTPQSHRLYISGTTEEDAVNAAYEWRKINKESGCTTRFNNRFYIGLLFVDQIELIRKG